MNTMLNTFLHRGLNIINRKLYLRFINGMKNSKEYQQKKLLETLKILKELPAHKVKLSNINNYQDFKTLPVASYSDMEQDVLIQQNSSLAHFCQNIVRFQPTSGSSNHIKWIPYNESLLKEFDQAAAIWLAELAKHYPGILKGKHYWSLSWLPNDLREKQNIDDSEILSPLRKFFMKNIFAVDQKVMHTKSIEENLFATVCFLAKCDDLSLISIWSPTFLLSLLSTLEQRVDDVVQVLETGIWPDDMHLKMRAPKNGTQAKKLKNNSSYQDLWPHLALISCWDTAQSKVYASKLRKIFPKTPIQGKGLWTTEAVITIPIKKEYVLAYQSHFYEFEELTSKNIFPSWELKVGMQVSPIVTTSNGMIRYKINDRLEVTKMDGDCPSLTFLGRIGDCDLVGEKLSHQNVEEIFANLDDEVKPIGLVGVQSPLNEKLPYYLCLVHKGNSQLEERIEVQLQEIFHYKLARELNQLGAVRVIASQNIHEIYEQLCINKGMIKGNIKVDPLIMTKTDEFIYATR